MGEEGGSTASCLHKYCTQIRNGINLEGQHTFDTVGNEMYLRMESLHCATKGVDGSNQQGSDNDPGDGGNPYNLVVPFSSASAVPSFTKPTVPE